MAIEKRFYTRYPLTCECLVAYESGLKYDAEILDISAEGAKLRIDSPLSLKVGDVLYVIIKCKYKIKVKGEIRWVRQEKFTYFGLKFLDLTMQDREALSKLLSEIALASLSDINL